jgi:stearoyl-CoA desaturase (delta-9 desaturase)
VLNTLIFGGWGIVMWGIQMIWIPFWAAGVINGLGHWWGYRNGETRDLSRNLVPWGIIIGGEELHNNHHLDPASACLSKNWYEFDIGWMWLSLFRMLGLARLRNQE